MNDFHPYFIREELFKAIRAYFYSQSFHEILSPVFNTAIPTEPNIYPFTTVWNARSKSTTLYLPASPEREIKIQLGRGIGNCFAIGNSFRNLENSGSLHNPEFYMLEWYRENAIYQDIMRDVQSLLLTFKKQVDMYLKKEFSPILTYQGTTVDLSVPFPVISLEKMLAEKSNIILKDVLTPERLFTAAAQKGYSVKDTTWGAIFDQILVNEIEPSLPHTPYFLVDFPSQISPLCTVNPEKPYLAERFEVYAFGMELGNGNNEQTNATLVQARFEAEEKEREILGIPYSPLDTAFLTALEQMSHKKYAGIGMGVDRLAMLFTGSERII